MSTTTATVNVIDGHITVQPSDATDTDIHTAPDGRVRYLASEVAPWGAEEQSMDRAERELADMGWQVTGPWSGAEHQVTAPVEPA